MLKLHEVSPDNIDLYFVTNEDDSINEGIKLEIFDFDAIEWERLNMEARKYFHLTIQKQPKLTDKITATLLNIYSSLLSREIERILKNSKNQK